MFSSPTACGKLAGTLDVPQNRSTMKTRTFYFAPGRAAPGMTLARPVLDKDGHTLISAGTTLDSDMLERLVRRGVEAIAILTPDTRDPATIAEEVSLAEGRVAAIFRGTGSPARNELQEAVLAYRRESLQ